MSHIWRFSHRLRSVRCLCQPSRYRVVLSHHRVSKRYARMAMRTGCSRFRTFGRFHKYFLLNALCFQKSAGENQVRMGVVSNSSKTTLVRRPGAMPSWSYNAVTNHCDSPFNTFRGCIQCYLDLSGSVNTFSVSNFLDVIDRQLVIGECHLTTIQQTQTGGTHANRLRRNCHIA